MKHFLKVNKCGQTLNTCVRSMYYKLILSECLSIWKVKYSVVTQVKGTVHPKPAPPYL